jgi:predicted protein tyrosine phosphatase
MLAAWALCRSGCDEVARRLDHPVLRLRAVRGAVYQAVWLVKTPPMNEQQQMNRMYTAGNPYQGTAKRVLCVCSAGLLRSPTAALVLSQEPFNFNTRAAGIEESYSLIHVDEVLVHWAQELVCMTHEHEQMLRIKFPTISKPIKVLEIPDNFEYRNPELMRLIAAKYASGGDSKP